MTETKHICDCCGKKFDTPKAIRNQISVINGEFSKILDQVCDACCKKVKEFVDSLAK